MTHSQPSNGHGVCPIFRPLGWRSQFGEVWLQETRFSWRGPPSHQGVLLNSDRSCTPRSVERQIRSEALGVSRQWKTQGQRRPRGFRNLRTFGCRKYRSGYESHGLSSSLRRTHSPHPVLVSRPGYGDMLPSLTRKESRKLVRADPITHARRRWDLVEWDRECRPAVSRCLAETGVPAGLYGLTRIPPILEVAPSKPVLQVTLRDDATQCCRRGLACAPYGVVSRCGFTHQQSARCCPYMGPALCGQVGSTKTPLPFTMRT